MTKPLYRYRDEHGHHVTLPYSPERVANDPTMAGLTYLADHPAVDINGNAIPAKPHTSVAKKAAAKRTARLTKTSPAVAEDRPTEAAVSNTEATKEATK